MKKIILFVLVALVSLPVFAQTSASELSTVDKVKALANLASNDTLTDAQILDSIIAMNPELQLVNIALDDTIACQAPVADGPSFNVIAGIIAVSFPFITILIIVFLVLFFNYRKRIARHNLINNAIEHNYQLSEQLLNDSKISNNSSAPSNVPSKKEWDELIKGATTAIVGLCLWIAFGVDQFLGQIFLIPLLLGALRCGIAIYKMKHFNNNASQQNSTPQPPEVPQDQE